MGKTLLNLYYLKANDVLVFKDEKVNERILNCTFFSKAEMIITCALLIFMKVYIN